MEDFTGKRVLIFGGASGIGLAIANKYMKCGARVAVMDVHQERINELTQIMPNDRFIGTSGDVRDSRAIQLTMDEIVQHWHGIDIMVYSAGIFPDRLLLDMTEEEWDTVMDINTKGAFLTGQITARQLVKQGTGGSIVTIASGSYKIGRVGSGHYCASKGALVMLTKVLALELAKYNIKVNSIAPGLVENPILSEEYKQSFTKQIPMGRIAQADDIASSVLMITSNNNTFITGQAIMVDGGTTAGRYGLPMSNRS